jgi:ornithine cyclodeaminase/alanine dehydrogenase-like protein (mu-crystallin family)
MSTLIIPRSDIRRMMMPADYLVAVDQAFRAAATGKAFSPHPMHLPLQRGGFHAKGASISLERDYVAIKVNGKFPGNRQSLACRRSRAPSSCPMEAMGGCWRSSIPPR